MDLSKLLTKIHKDLERKTMFARYSNQNFDYSNRTNDHDFSHKFYLRLYTSILYTVPSPINSLAILKHTVFPGASK